MRPIDADTLVYDLYNDVPIRAFGSCKRIGEMIKYIQKRPTIDAVPVVRCKDCKWYKCEGGQCPSDNTDDPYYSWIPDPDWFCKDGELKEDD